jgi:hypothetical protein
LEPGHFARDCLSKKVASKPGKPKKTINYLTVEESSEDESEEEVFLGQRKQPYSTNRKDAKQKQKQSESAKEFNLRTRKVKTQPMDIEPETIVEFQNDPYTPQRKSKKSKMKSQPSVVDNLPSYDISEDILNLPAKATLGQMLQYP